MATDDNDQYQTAPQNLAGMKQAPMGARPAAPHMVQLVPASTKPTDDQALWAYIRAATNRVGWTAYQDFVDKMFCTQAGAEQLQNIDKLSRMRLPFPGVDAYHMLKVVTEVFLMKSCGIRGPDADNPQYKVAFDAQEESGRFNRPVTADGIEAEFEKLVGRDEALPYLDIVRSKLGVPVAESSNNLGLKCYGILREKLVNPCMLELIWSYWHEEGMLVQTMNAISMRFQNRRSNGGRDPLANLEIDPLRPLNNLLWGYIQDEQHRLSVVRRAYEYDHHYGISLEGKAVPQIRGADSRSKFLEAFHSLLQQAWIFYKQDDDTTVVADGFPVLNALKEVHLLLTQGGHNQYGDLPWNARLEMLMQQWLLARPEMREFLSGRAMVAYAEPWMDRVDVMKTLQGWTDTTVSHFRDLGVFGEQVLLTIRWQPWNSVFDRDRAANWARYWRQEIQAYLHAYRAATGVELRNAGAPDAIAPSVHLRNRLAAQARPR